MGLLKELWKRMVEGSNDDPAWSVLRERNDFWVYWDKAHQLVKGGVILPEAHGEAVAYSAWGSLNAAEREKILALVPSTDVDALAKWFYDHREEEHCWWRTQYRCGEPRIRMDPFGGSDGYDIGWGRGGRWIANVEGARCVDRLQRAASRKYAELVLEWRDDPAREKYLRLMGISNDDGNGQ